MTTNAFVDRVIFNATSTGTGNFVVASAVTGYNTPALSGALDGRTYRYSAQTTSGGSINAWEVGEGVYTVSSTTLARTRILLSSNSNAVVNFAAVPQVMITALSEDFFIKVDTGQEIDIYVDPGGSDTTGDGSFGNPFQTIQHAVNYVALNVVTANDYTTFVVIYLLDGTYSESVELPGMTSDGQNCYYLIGYNSDATLAVITGDVICTGGQWTLNFLSCAHVHCQGAGARIDVTQHCHITGTDGQPHFAVGSSTAQGTEGVIRIGTIAIPNANIGASLALCNYNGFIAIDHAVITFSVDPQYSAIFSAGSGGRMHLNASDTTWVNTGGYTGPKVLLTNGGQFIVTNGADLSSVPGGSVGTIDSSSRLIAMPLAGPPGIILSQHFTGDSGSGGTIGYVPAPASGDAAAGKFLKADATWTAVSSPTGANPTATATDTAVNGSASTFMRSDGAPAVQKTSSSVFGLCKVDNTTITATGGIISSTGGSANMIINSSVVTGGTTGEVLYSDGSHILQQAANFTISSGNPNVTAGNQYLYNGVNAIRADVSLRNWFFGENAGTLSASGAGNYGLGRYSAASLTSGHDNVFVGEGSGNAVTSGSGNIGVGNGTMANMIGQFNNIAIGGNAGSNFGGGQNTMVGAGSGPAVSGSNNAGIGAFSFSSAASGDNNLGVGFGSLQNLNGGNNNCAVGSGALSGTITGSNNFGFGASSFTNNTSGSDNVGIGASAGINNVSGIRNICLGTGSGSAMQTDWGNTIVGYNAGAQFNAGAGAVTGNTIIGYDTAHNLTTGQFNTIIGQHEQIISTGSQCISIGSDCGVPTGTANGELVIGNYIYGIGLTGTTSTVSSGKIGLGIKAPTAVLHLQNSSTARAQINFDPTSAAAPTSPNDGDMWYDGTHLKFRIGTTSITVV